MNTSQKILKTEYLYCTHSFCSLWHNWWVKETEYKSFCNTLKVDFIFSALRKFGYGDKFIHMIKVAYTNIESKIKISGLLSDPLILMFVRQGCLLFMLLYNIVVVVLANFIYSDKRIKGIQIGDHEVKIVNFTDNTIIFLRDITCLNRIQVILRLYEKDKLVQR